MSRAVWFHSACVDTNRSAEILECLAEPGLELRELDLAEPRHPILILFEQMSPELCRLLSDVGRNGLDRVIAVATSRAALGSGDAWRLLAAGASDVVAWQEPAATARQIAARLERWAMVDAILRSSLVERNLVGKSRIWTAALRHVVEVAKFTSAPVLILGESGTGKELAARLIHTLDPRPDKGELVIVDCTTIVPELSGSEFFGHERGAFTGAVGPRDGAFALADGGTLFLDEVGELPPALQAQLLRVVQERTYKKVGGNTWHKTEFRLICATNRDVLGDVENGTFRRDLYYRIASTICRLPALRERTEDILPLVHHFASTVRADAPALNFEEEVREYLLCRSYPGNVRDLRQLVSRILYRHVPPGPVTVGDLPDDERPQDPARTSWRNGAFEEVVRRAIVLGAGMKDIGRTAEDLAVRIAVADEDGNLQRAASRLGVTDRALQLRRASRRAD